MPRLYFALLSALILGATPSRADTFDVRPITIETRDGSSAVVISNPGSHRIYLEAKILDWSQDASGNERLVESGDAIVSPPATWIQPGRNYLLRMRLPPSDASNEHAYRVVINQIPDRDEIAAGRVIFALTQSLPAFVAAATSEPPRLQVERLAANRLLFRNDGGRRLRLTRIVQNGRVLATGLIGYTLAHGALAVTLQQLAEPGMLEVETDLGVRTIALR